MNLRRFGSKRVWIAVAVVVAIGLAAGIPSWQLQKQKDANEQAFVLSSFSQQVGQTDPATTQITKVTEGVYMASWINDDAVHAAWSIGGLWIEVYSQPMEQPQQPAEEPAAEPVAEE